MRQRADTIEGKVALYQTAVTLQPLVEEVKAGLPMRGKRLFDDLIIKRPVDFWSDAYLRQLGILCMSILTMEHYKESAMKAAFKNEFVLAESLNKMANNELTVITQLQKLLQLTPSQTVGESRLVNKRVDTSNEILEAMEKDDSELF